MRDRRLAEAAEAVMRCLGIRASDDVLVVCNEAQHHIGEALAGAADGSARTVRILEFPALSRDGEEPPALVADAIAEATVVIAATTFSLNHTQARRDSTERGARVASMPGITRDAFVRAVPVDYEELTRIGARIADELTRASSCRVTSPSGTDVVLSLAGRAAIPDDGDLQADGAWGNLPAGEAFIAPVETSAEGVIVFDGALAGYGELREPLAVEVAAGRALRASGEGAEWLFDTLGAGGRNGRVLAELGIGTNPRARLRGRILEDEKVLGTIHFAFGTTTSFGGTNVATVHIDGLVRRPAVELDGRLILQDGRMCERCAL